MELNASAVESTEVLALWPQGAPGSENWQQAEEETRMPPHGLPVVRNVIQPSLTVYHPVAANGTAVIVCPGGAFHFLAIEHEGRQVASWLAAQGITTGILRYRLIQTGANLAEEVSQHMNDQQTMGKLMSELYPLIEADGCQAVHLVREHAAE